MDLLDLLQSLHQEEVVAVAGAATDAASIQEVASSSWRNQRSGEAAVASPQDGGTQWNPGPGPGPGPDSGPGRDLGLLLGCTGVESAESCQGVQLLHTPFMAVYYS